MILTTPVESNRFFLFSESDRNLLSAFTISVELRRFREWHQWNDITIQPCCSIPRICVLANGRSCACLHHLGKTPRVLYHSSPARVLNCDFDAFVEQLGWILSFFMWLDSAAASNIIAIDFRRRALSGLHFPLCFHKGMLWILTPARFEH